MPQLKTLITYRLSTTFNINFEIDIFYSALITFKIMKPTLECVLSPNVSLFSLLCMLITRRQLGSHVIKMEGYKKGAMYCCLKQ